MTDTSALSPLMQTYYDKMFVEYEQEVLVYTQFAQERPLPSNEGKTVNFTRYTRLARATTALTEGTNPTGVDLSATTVSVTVAEYGNYTKISKFVSLTAFDRDISEAVSIMAQNGAETIDRLTREAMYSGMTVNLITNNAALTDLGVTDIISTIEVRKMTRTLKKAYAQTFKDGMYRGIIGPDAAFDLTGDTTWTAAKTYSDVKDLYVGEVGSLHRVRFIETQDTKTEASTVTVHTTFFVGQNAYGATTLEGDDMNIYVKKSGSQDTSNPLSRFSTCGWAQTYAAKVLVATWVQGLKSGVTA